MCERAECWECVEAIRKADNPFNHFNDAIMVGCDLVDSIKSYGDAETMCPKRGVDAQV